MRPVGALVAVRDLVPVIRLFGALGGSTILWVDRTDCATPGRAGLRPELPARGITIGWVVTEPADIPDAETNPDGCGGFTKGMTPDAGGV